MAKDPAFLFYSKDFYEGTRMMLPEERACLIDLMIYQHQNGGFIPNDLKRVAMYCSGITEAMLKATLEAKFKLCDKGWYNKKLNDVVEERNTFSKKQSLNGKVGQFWKKAKAILNAKEYKKLIQLLENQTKEQILNQINNKDINEAMLKAMLKHLEDAIAIEDVIEDEDENKILKNKILFTDSKYFDLEFLKMNLQKCEPPYNQANTEYYYHSMLNWSNENNQKKIDWLATCKNWILRDFKEGKLIDKNYKPNNGKFNNKSEYTNGRTPFDEM